MCIISTVTAVSLEARLVHFVVPAGDLAILQVPHKWSDTLAGPKLDDFEVARVDKLRCVFDTRTSVSVSCIWAASATVSQ